MRGWIGIASIALALSSTAVIAQDDLDDVRAELEAIYGMYRIGDYCRSEGLWVTTDTLADIQEVAARFEGQLSDEGEELRLWEDSAEEAALQIAYMAIDRSVAEAQCGQYSAIVGFLVEPARTQKPF